jgi:uncharacterized protein (TIGR02466 family)
MKIEQIFTTPIAMDFLELDNISLENFCRKTINSAKGHPNQSGSLDLASPELQPLLAEINSRLELVHFNLKFKSGTKFKITKAWANINNSAPINIPHCHPGSVFSAVYYVKGAGSLSNGELVLLSPLASTIQYALPEEHKEYNNYFNSWNCTIAPETGKLVMFPSWTMHSVSENEMKNSDRISIAIDAMIC